MTPATRTVASHNGAVVRGSLLTGFREHHRRGTYCYVTTAKLPDSVPNFRCSYVDEDLKLSGLTLLLFHSILVSQYSCTILFLHLRNVSVIIFGHHQVVFTQSLSTLSVVPLLLVKVYSWGRSYCFLQCRFLVVDLN
jgi:hypothetical protein